MREINNLLDLEKIVKKNENIVIYIYANWCIDCKLYEMNISDSFTNINQKNIFSLNQDNFKIFIEEYKLLRIPNIAIFNNYQLINSLGDGRVLNHKLVNSFIKKYL